MTKYRDTYTYITEIEKNLGECIAMQRPILNIIKGLTYLSLNLIYDLHRDNLTNFFVRMSL
jgi:hypothetical protein